MRRTWSREPQSTLDRECVEYFRSSPVFDRLLRGFRDKYASYGSFSGKVTLTNLGSDEIESLEGFFQKNYHGQASVTISAERFERALRDSRFGGTAPREILELYFQEEMSSRREQRRAAEEARQAVFAEMLGRYAGTAAEAWLEEVRAGGSAAGSYLSKRCREPGGDMRGEARRLLRLGAEMVNHFPVWRGGEEYLPVFAAQVTGNPHAFDDGTRDGKFLELLAQWAAARRGIEADGSGVFPALQRQREYLAVGLLKDDISNYVMLSGVRAVKKSGEAHLGMEGFIEEGDMVQVPLSVIAGWQRAECPGGQIFIVENPSVYAVLCRRYRGGRAFMCMNGQPRLSAVLMLDLLAQSGTVVYYAGDFDPEGLLIAQKVGRYYRGEFVYWHMSAEEYAGSKSNERLSPKRMKMLDRITDDRLRETADAVRRAGVAGYQENIWDILADTD